MVDSIIGKTLGKYQIMELLGRGAMAEVYQAYHPALDRHVAIKILHSFLAEDKDFLDRFQREAKAAGHLRHPNIVQVHDFDVTDGVYYYIVMEFIDGYTLEAKLRELTDNNKIMPLEEATRIARDVASALSYAHGRNMIHRDIKPSNVMINRDNQVILTDFGIVKILGSPQYTSAGAIAGTPNYISPEQGLGKPQDARSDIYSLGAMFFQMVTDQPPYSADSGVAVLLKHVNDPIPIASQLNPALPSDIDRIIIKAMAKNPRDRYQSADEFIEHLNRVGAGASITDTSLSTFLTTTGIDLTGQSASVFSAFPPTSPPPVATLSGAVGLAPYILSSDHLATDPADLPAVCDDDWDRAVDHFAKGYITDWLRDGVNRLRTAHLHGPADELGVITARAEAIVQRIQSGDDIARNAGLEEFLESLGATPAVIDITPKRLDLPAVGVGETGQPVTLTITNTGRGYLFGNVVCRVPWLKVAPEWFGCKAGECSTITVNPDLSGLPSGRIQSSDSLQIHSIGGDQDLTVRVDILPSVLQVDVPALDFGEVGQGETSQTTFTIRNSGRGYLIGRVCCRVGWLTASPEQFKVPARDSIQVVVNVDSEALPPGDATHAWALVLESNGGHTVLGVHIRVLPPRLQVEPAQIDLGTIDLAQPDATRSAKLMVRNTGPGVLTGAVMAEADWLTAKPAAFRCRAGEAQPVRLSTVRLTTGNHREVVHAVSNAGVAEVEVLLHVRFHLEPEMVGIPAGEFLRGSKERDKKALASEKPQRQIYLSDYWIGKHPVTNAQYAVFVEATGRRPPEHWEGSRPPEGKEDHPVVNVSWWDALAYCHWLAEVTGKPYRLPTEAQWEKASRGTDGRTYPWGNRWDDQKCNTKEGNKRGTTPVGTFSPAGDSPYGCTDMAGNVLEWTANWYREDYYAHSSISQDPYGPASGAVKVLRGGSWSSNRMTARCANRYKGNQTATSPEAGFRCALFTTKSR
ncbi:MAG: bifunctional serine/threonine-protein kinase/formylglycine-generating enzyme family protein [Chloroflexota bacterium]|nr:bifunctional serine/threonine-protein kinase/formylglycine-generating enzyme family protein [Chloroflexota bacterium]